MNLCGAQAIRLWRVCIEFGVDTDCFSTLFPPLLARKAILQVHKPEPSSTPSAQASAEYRDVVNVLEGLCDCRFIPSTPPTFDHVRACLLIRCHAWKSHQGRCAPTRSLLLCFALRYPERTPREPAFNDVVLHKRSH